MERGVLKRERGREKKARRREPASSFWGKWKWGETKLERVLKRSRRWSAVKRWRERERERRSRERRRLLRGQRNISREFLFQVEYIGRSGNSPGELNRVRYYSIFATTHRETGGGFPNAGVRHWHWDARKNSIRAMKVSGYRESLQTPRHSLP